MCGECDEHLSHIVAGCKVLARSKYLHRHNKVVNYLQWSMLKELGMLVPDRWYDHVPDNVVETEDQVIIYDFPISTDCTIAANRPDIVYYNKRKKHRLLITE
jgi:hypothetical protein